MTYYVGNMPCGEDELTHWGVKGMKWGQRRYQNRDGSLTAAGRVRYGWGKARSWGNRQYRSARRSVNKAYRSGKRYYNRNQDKIKRAAKIAGAGAAIVGLGALGYRNRAALKAAGRAARTFTRSKAAGLDARMFPLGSKRRQIRTRLGVEGGNFIRKARNSKSAQFINATGRKVRNAGMTARGTVSSGAKVLGASAKSSINSGVNAVKNSKPANYIRRVPAKVSAKKANYKLAKAQGNFYKQTGIVGTRMTKGQKRLIDATESAKRKTASARRKARNAGMTIKGTVSSGAKVVGGSISGKARSARSAVGSKMSSAKSKVVNKALNRAAERERNKRHINNAKAYLGTKSNRKAKRYLREANSLVNEIRARSRGKDYQRVSRARAAYDRARMNPGWAIRRGGAALGAAGAVGGGAYYYGRRRKKKSRR